MPTDRLAEAPLTAPRAPALAARLALALRSEAALYAGLTLILVAPLFCFATLPLYDLPNHLARQHILFGEGAPGADRYYAAHWRLIPNLALDGGVYLLHHFVSVERATRLFVAATLAQLFLGTLALNRALFGRRPGIAFAAALFAYSGPFLFGFINVSFGFGMTLWVFALWLRWRRRSALQPLLALLAGAILAAHLFAFGVYALVVGCTWAGDALRRRRQEKAPLPDLLRSFWQLAHLLLPLGIYALLMPRESHEMTGQYLPFVYKLYWLGAAVGFFDPGYNLVFLVILLGGALCVARRLVVAPVMYAPLAGLALGFVALPERLGEGAFVDYRMPLIAFLFLIASTSWRDGAAGARGKAIVFTLAMLVLRLGPQFAEWATWQPIYAEYRAAFALLPQGARLLPLRTPPYGASFYDRPPLWHYAAEAVTERGALIPDLFANMGHQLLVYRPAYRPLWKLATDPTAADAAAYDYVLLLYPERFAPASLPRYALLARGRTFVLGRLLH